MQQQMHIGVNGKMNKLFPYGVIEPSKAVETADKVLNVYFAITKKLKIRSCIAYGICLGFIRDGGYIPGDNDLDVIAFTETGAYSVDLIEALKRYGFKKGQAFSQPANNIHFYRDEILLDVFFRQPTGLYAKLGRVKYKDKVYLAPSPVNAYLSSCYDNWGVKANQDGKKGV